MKRAFRCIQKQFTACTKSLALSVHSAENLQHVRPPAANQLCTSMALCRCHQTERGLTFVKVCIHCLAIWPYKLLKLSVDAADIHTEQVWSMSAGHHDTMHSRAGLNRAIPCISGQGRAGKGRAGLGRTTPCTAGQLVKCKAYLSGDSKA